MGAAGPGVNIAWRFRMSGQGRTCEGPITTVIPFDGTPVEMWEHAETWGNAFLGSLRGRYRVLVTVSPLFARRYDATARDGMLTTPPYRFLSEGLSPLIEKGVQRGIAIVSCDAIDPTAHPSFFVVFHQDQMSVTSSDGSARQWVAGLLAMDDEELSQKTWVSPEEYAFLRHLITDESGDMPVDGADADMR